MNPHNEHVNAYFVHKFKTIFGGKTIHEHKRDAIVTNRQYRVEFEQTQPAVGDRVYFCSISIVNNQVFTGHGEVINIHVKDYKKKFALYKIKTDHGMNYEAYINHPDPEQHGEFVRYV